MNKLLLLLLALLVLPLASAANFDNTKIFKDPSNIKEVTIENKFGWFDEEIATVRLDTPLYNYVPAGNDVLIAEITINNIESYKSALQKVESYDLRKGGKKENGREFTFRIKSIEMVDVPVVDEHDNVVGSEKHERVFWYDFGKDVPAGEVTIGIFTDTTAGELFDFVPTLFGAEIDEWAVVSVTETIQGGTWAPTAGVTNARGWNITIEETINITAFIRDSASTATRAIIRNTDNTVTLFTSTSLAGDTITFGGAGANLSAGNYRFLMDASGGAYAISRLTGEALPQDTGVINWIEGANENGDDDGQNILSIVFNRTFPENVSASINFPRGNPSYNTQQINFSYNVSGLNANVSNASLYLFNQSLTDLNNDASLVAWYKLDGNALDATGINNGTLVNSPQPVEGMIGGSYQLINNTKQNIVINATSLNINQRDVKTICAWIKAIGSLYANEAFLGFNGQNILQVEANGKIRLEMAGNSSGGRIFSTNTINANEWSFICYNQTLLEPNIPRTIGDADIWINGIKEIKTFNSIGSSVPGNATTFNIGSSNVGYTACCGFNGSIDDVRIYNRSLSAAEINTLWTQTQAVHKEVGINAPSRSFLNASINNTPEGQWNLTVYANGFSNITPTLYVQSFSSVESFTVETVAPTIDIVYPEGIIPYHKSGNNLTLNYTFNDPNPDICKFNYGINQPNTTLADCGTNSSFNVTNYAIRNITIYINDSAGNTGYNLSSWAYYVFENSRSFSPSTSELATETYTINATYNSSIFSGLGVYFNYNGTNYSTSSTGSAPESMTFSSTLTVPSVPSAQNIPFYWIFVLQNDTGTEQLLTDISTQTVNDLALDNCTAATQVILNYTLRDEDLQNILLAPTANTTLDINVRLSAIQNSSQFITYTASKNNTNPVTICVSPTAFNGGANYRLDSVVGYEASDREYEFHNIQNLTISNATVPQNISLFDLLTSRSTEFVIRYRDSALNPVPDVLIDISRQYIGEGVFKSVEVPKTDFEGKTVGHLVVNEVIYNIIVSKEGKVISTFTNIIASCQNPSITDCTIDLQQYSEGVNPVDLEQAQGAVFNISFNPTARVVNSIFSTLNGASSNFTFLVSTFGNNTQICSQSLTTSSGMITCNIPQTTGNVTFVAKLYKDNVLLGQSIASLKIANRDLFGNTGAIMAFFLYLLLPFIALSSGAVPVLIFAVIGFFLIGAMFLINTPVIFGTGSALIWLGITVIIILIKYNMRER